MVMVSKRRNITIGTDRRSRYTYVFDIKMRGFTVLLFTQNTINNMHAEIQIIVH